jgi:hypothetical protein
MKFGVREICDVVFKAKSSGELGTYKYNAGQPVLYIDSAKTSTIEGASTTVYAQGGKGNARLVAWEGEKTLTFTVEDALLSPIGFAILSGAQILKPSEKVTTTKVHKTAVGKMGTDGEINIHDYLEDTEDICADAPVFVMVRDGDNSLTGEMLQGFEVQDYTWKVNDNNVTKKHKLGKPEGGTITNLNKETITTAKDVFVDFYVEKNIANVHELTIDAGNFAGNWYVEASTLFRRQEDGKDLPAEIVFPNVKIQSNFTFNMAATGDPSTFTFTMDALPGRVEGKEGTVLCVIQVVEDEFAETAGAVTSKDSIVDKNN